MKSVKEIEAKIKELEEEMSYAYSDEPKPFCYDPYEEVPRLEVQIDILNWILKD